ncbi:hypothetical protein Slin15195_G007230 [Septoria linicola]|uniref:Pal1-domain-containing protein n=1 Tax=Septoria linicola TaxID=215465 RepID=A0A9Q9AD81_9PEZI|nr:hypothetical protein Slin14017_G007240 [Septoria linicola]USW47404.1 hypothetical protein Slin15195_G007230 [Septoria linicola]
MAFFADAAAAPDRQREPVGLSLSLPPNNLPSPSLLSSNNPFRRAASPSPTIPSYYNSAAAGTPPAVQRPERPMSTNPFLDDSEVARLQQQQPKTRPVQVPEDIFNELSLLDKPLSNGQGGAGAYIVKRPENRGLPRPGGPPPPPPYRPVGDRERPPRPPRSPEKNGFPRARPRRASESSVMEKERRPRMDRDEGRERTESSERRRAERRKEREERHRRDKQKPRNGEKPRRKPQGLDIIDKLDVTGIYGQGLFHHDGPFDACNPHRNAKKDRRAPMQAFPADSANMQLGGAGPLRSRLDLDKFHGRGEEGFSEFAATRKKTETNQWKTEPITIDPMQKVEPVHGQETYGLGTSTFLEGAPASRKDMQRRDSEDPELYAGGGGLTRKKSIAQRFRGMSASKRERPTDLRSPEARYQYGGPTSPPLPQNKAVSAGGPVQARYNKENEVNPFDNDYEAAFEKKGTQIRIAEQEKPYNRARAGSSPRAPPLTRTQTSDARLPSRNGRGSSGDEERPTTSGVSGFLNRMRSVKGGPRRPRAAAE